jgi:ADP-heptose:LPS heptosyltransferase
MHLAGAVNTPTISFFGDSLFASSKRWATVSSPARQHNFMLGKDYSKEMISKIEVAMLNTLTQKPNL